MQADGKMAVEPRMNADDVGRAVVYIANLPLDTNVLFMTVMANLMPFVDEDERMPAQIRRRERRVRRRPAVRPITWLGLIIAGTVGGRHERADTCRGSAVRREPAARGRGPGRVLDSRTLCRGRQAKRSWSARCSCSIKFPKPGPVRTPW